MTCSAGALTGTDFCLIFAPSKGYDEPEILPSSIRSICLIGADAGQRRPGWWRGSQPLMAMIGGVDNYVACGDFNKAGLRSAIRMAKAADEA
jgi:hypothetical protein